MGRRSRVKKALRNERQNSDQFRTKRFKDDIKAAAITVTVVIAIMIFASPFVDNSSLTKYIIYFPSILSFVGALFIIYKQHSIQSWIETTCIIESRDIEGSSYHSSFYPYIYFRYKVNGTEYVANIVNYGRMYSSYDKANMKVQKFEFGKKYKCYYNPQKPKEAVLEKDFQAHTFFLLLLLSITMLAFPLIISLSR
ncbi:MAG: DUF3592 domain-containing protein [Bacteroidota bacterium]|nr:DUF3592 domain-containing protein [Bacteroidota bacterium]